MKKLFHNLEMKNNPEAIFLKKASYRCRRQTLGTNVYIHEDSRDHEIFNHHAKVQ